MSDSGSTRSVMRYDDASLEAELEAELPEVSCVVSRDEESSVDVSLWMEPCREPKTRTVPPELHPGLLLLALGRLRWFPVAVPEF